MTKILKFDELGGMAQDKFFAQARLLIEKEYVRDIPLAVLAARLYDSYIKDRTENPEKSSNNQFLEYDKETIWDVEKIKKDGIWLK